MAKLHANPPVHKHNLNSEGFTRFYISQVLSFSQILYILLYALRIGYFLVLDHQFESLFVHVNEPIGHTAWSVCTNIPGP